MLTLKELYAYYTNGWEGFYDGVTQVEREARWRAAQDFNYRIQALARFRALLTSAHVGADADPQMQLPDPRILFLRAFADLVVYESLEPFEKEELFSHIPAALVSRRQEIIDRWDVRATSIGARYDRWDPTREDPR